MAMPIIVPTTISLSPIGTRKNPMPLFLLYPQLSNAFPEFIPWEALGMPRNNRSDKNATISIFVVNCIMVRTGARLGRGLVSDEAAAGGLDRRSSPQLRS